MEEKDIKKMTKKELMELKKQYNGEEFNAIVIVPMNYKHDSGYQCMKYILLNNWKIVGTIGGSSDVIHFNGICGFGKNTNYSNKTTQIHDIRIDCLPESQCVRIFSTDMMETDDYFISDFVWYFKDK